jgi:hypothetical protein
LSYLRAVELTGVPVPTVDCVNVLVNRSFESAKPVGEGFRGNGSEVPEEMIVSGVERRGDWVLVESTPPKVVGRGEGSDDPSVKYSERGGKAVEGRRGEGLRKGRC